MLFLFLKTKIFSKKFEEKILYLLFSQISGRISGTRQNYWLDIRPNQYPVQP